MSEEEECEVPDGAAVFPLIPDELGINPLLLGIIHATVFLAGSTKNIVNPEAADETLGRFAEYLQRLDGERYRAVREDLDCLVRFAKQEKWPKQMVVTLQSFLEDFGIGGENEA